MQTNLEETPLTMTWWRTHRGESEVGVVPCGSGGGGGDVMVRGRRSSSKLNLDD